MQSNISQDEIVKLCSLPRLLYCSIRLKIINFGYINNAHRIFQKIDIISEPFSYIWNI